MRPRDFSALPNCLDENTKVLVIIIAELKLCNAQTRVFAVIRTNVFNNAAFKSEPKAFIRAATRNRIEIRIVL
jgi:hypothetical protein